MRPFIRSLPWIAGLLTGFSLPLAAASDALVPGTDFHATGSIPCATASGQPMTSCPFGVRRAEQGAAWVTIFLPDNASRVIRFEQGQATSIEGSASGVSFSAERENDLTRVHSGNERFEIPDAVVFGG